MLLLFVPLHALVMQFVFSPTLSIVDEGFAVQEWRSLQYGAVRVASLRAILYPRWACTHSLPDVNLR